MDLDSINTVEDVANYLSEQQKELQNMIHHREVVEAERYKVTREILDYQLKIKELQIKKTDLDKSLSKAKSVCARLALEIKRANSKFWSMRNV